ncbi:phosphate transport system permease protein [Salinibacillus kushneri]|uniref:Phosphate transport system permease protein PstA n=1 Tax=Salinibacillus kushneri TaxID=237682 RepID=A0A1I0FWJ6_9BACI|nr:phosphate ABC transporter permease PstA [Salinibacillus kushneri]SET62871.1 phosphate transport system permease protein [Salinibacillus kushneri]
MPLRNQDDMYKRRKRRTAKNNIFRTLFFTATTVGLIVLAMLIYRVLSQGTGSLSWDFIRNFAAPYPDEAGLLAGIVGSLYLMGIVAIFSIVVGVSTAIYLEEYAKKGKLTTFIQMNIQNLAGVPSVVFGLLGLTFFVYVLDFGYSLLTGGLTMSLLVLPIIVVSSQEALRSVPSELKEASAAMGASKWQTIFRVVLPAALPGMITGSILALSRAIGETAPLLVVGAATAIYSLPDSVVDSYTVMPIQIYSWISKPGDEWPLLAAAGIIILLIFLLIMNTIAVLIRNKFQRRY